MYTLQLNLNVYLLDEKPVSGAAAAKRQYEEDSSSEEEEVRKTKQKVPKIDILDSSDDDDSPLIPSQSKVLGNLIVN